MRYLLIPLLFVAMISTQAEEDKAAADVVFREPFTLKLHVDKEHFYEEKFGKIPYVDKNKVYLFSGDKFGITLEMQGKSIQAIKYQPDLKKADVTLKFSQMVEPNGEAMMMLELHNNTKQTLAIDALMTVPDQDGIAKTSILPVGPGMSGFESWPHPIVQLVLRNIRVAE